ncbi:DMT family transporter [Glaesserella sp.]|uniref:DMT family transporter n=1 Tax=Glaesserella sp. TaxID=2094731 RepID=UPI0035A02DB5
MSKSQPLFGFLFALIAVMMWGMLPIVLQQVLKFMDTQTIVWFRFVTAMVGLFVILFFAKKLPKPTACTRRDVYLLLLGIFGLSCNFYLFNLALNHIPPAASQIISPFSSLIMALIGVYLFKEGFGLHQKIGLVIVLIGLGLFFNDRFDDLAQMNEYAWGMLSAVGASLIWLCYSIAQKMMLYKFSSPQILLFIYFGCSLVFTPLTDLSQTANLTTFAWICLIFCCLNTVIAYGSYAEALNRWEVTKVSVMMPLIPICTILFSHLAFYLYPEHFAEPDFNHLTYFGAIVVVFGAMLSAAGHKLFYRHKRI